MKTLNNMNKQFKRRIILFIVFIVLDVIAAMDKNNDTKSLDDEKVHLTRVLSRQRRYLIFPDGSSVQLVFCEQNHGYLQLGDIVWFGITAALAWELPTDPNIYYHILKAEKGKLISGDGQLRRQDSSHLVYLDEDGKVISMVPYHRRKFLVNPAFAKRSVDGVAESNTIKTYSRKDLHELQKTKKLLEDLEEVSANFHRENRRSLYTKLETFFEKFGWSGKECVLRLLCDNSRNKKDQGYFMQEILRATFTFPKSAKPHESHKIYDEARSAEGNCAELYPECEADVLFE